MPFQQKYSCCSTCCFTFYYYYYCFVKKKKKYDLILVVVVFVVVVVVVVVCIQQTVSFYGVYDGHAGDRAAKYCSAHLLDVLVEQLCESEAQSDESRCDALSKAFIECDRALIETSAKANWCVLCFDVCLLWCARC